MSKVDMAVDLGGMQLKNPINTAAGAFGHAWQFEGFYDVSQLGAITCKGVAVEPWDGNPAPRLTKTRSGIMNSVGLQNPGIDAFMARYGAYLRDLSSRGTAVILQVIGHSVDEYIAGLERFLEVEDFAAGFEINVSCPNLEAGGATIGGTPEGAARVMRALRGRTDKPLMVKMAPTNVGEIARALEDAGADALSLINTIPSMAIDVTTRTSKLSRPTAGLSGPAIHPIAVRMVWEAHQASSLPICGIGGVTTGEEAAEFILAGATSVAVGTCNLYDPMASLRILGELGSWAEGQGVADINELIGALVC